MDVSLAQMGICRGGCVIGFGLQDKEMKIKFLVTEASYYTTAWFLKHWQVGKRPILIIAHGRSGTNWVGAVFSTARRVIYYNAPCSPGNTGKEKLTGKSDLDVWFRYLRPGERAPYYERSLDRAFRGLPYGARWHRGFWSRPLPNYQILVKEVASLMSLEWIAHRYDPKILVLLRHPCPTTLSLMKLGISAEQEKQALLRQSNLFDDHLGPYLSIIENTKTSIEKFAALWAARHRVVVNVLSRHQEWPVAYYEELCRDPVGRFHELFQQLGLDWMQQTEKYIINSSIRHVPGPFSTVRNSSQQVDNWKHEMTQPEIKSVRCIVEGFDLPYYRADHHWS